MIINFLDISLSRSVSSFVKWGVYPPWRDIPQIRRDLQSAHVMSGTQQVLKRCHFPLLLVTLPSPAIITLDGIGRILEQRYWHFSHPGKEAELIITPQTIYSSCNQQGKDTCQEAKVGPVIGMGSGDQRCEATSVSIYILQSFHWYLQNLSQTEQQQDSQQICWRKMVIKRIIITYSIIPIRTTCLLGGGRSKASSSFMVTSAADAVQHSLKKMG